VPRTLGTWACGPTLRHRGLGAARPWAPEAAAPPAASWAPWPRALGHWRCGAIPRHRALRPLQGAAGHAGGAIDGCWVLL